MGSAQQNLLIIVPLVGFAVQRALTLVDPWIDSYVTRVYAQKPGMVTPQSDFKASVMGIASLILGFLAAISTHIDLGVGSGGTATVANILLATLIFSAGTEGANSIQKYLQNVKDSSKADNTSTVAMMPSTVSLKAGTSMQFHVPDPKVLDWSVLESSASNAIDQVGNFTAPSLPGTYHVLAKMKNDPSVASIGIVTVT